jgi:glycosyltransferase involved in cell wall biosynthesis
LAAIETGDEIIVVDDGSSDDTVARLASFGDRVPVRAFHLRVVYAFVLGRRRHLRPDKESQEW